jgi:hypothetical protein
MFSMEELHLLNHRVRVGVWRSKTGRPDQQSMMAV